MLLLYFAVLFLGVCAYPLSPKIKRYAHKREECCILTISEVNIDTPGERVIHYTLAREVNTLAREVNEYIELFWNLVCGSPPNLHGYFLVLIDGKTFK